MVEKKYDVAVVGVGVGANYGSALTYFAITETIKEMGKSVILVNKIGGELSDIEISDKNPSFLFAKKHNEMTPYYRKEELQELNNYADTFVIGTDQVWGDAVASYAGEAFYLGFANDDKRKISIAGSFGHFDDFSPLDKIDRRRELFKRFNKISVRENDGVEILKNKYNVNATQIIEPVFYIDNEKWFQLADDSQFDTSDSYILTYILDNNPEKQKVVEKISYELQLPIQILPDGFENVIHGDKNGYKYTPEDVLKLIRDAKYVITDSFHGTSFSLKFNKNFVTLVNPKRGISRFDTLIDIIDNDDRIVKNYSTIINNPKKYLENIDYTKINSRINSAVIKAKKWISESLDSDISEKIEQVNNNLNNSLSDRITNTVFSFGRTDLEETYSTEWKFDKFGKIKGYINDNERYWKIFGQKIYIYNKNGKFSSVLIQNEDNDNFWIGKARFDNVAEFFLIDNQFVNGQEKIFSEKAENFQEQEIIDYLTNHTFVWYRKSQKHAPLSKYIQLLEDGNIYGMPNDASSKFWRVTNEGKKLEFTTLSGQVNVALDIHFSKEGLLKTQNGHWKRIGEEHILEDVFSYQNENLVPYIEINKPMFIFTSNNWQQTEKNDYYSVLRKKPGKLGDQAIIQLPQKLYKNILYSLKMNWSVKTYSPYVILHLKNSNTGKVQRVHFFKDRESELSSVGKVPVSTNIIPDADDYDQIMFSSLEFTGEKSGMSISKIKIDINLQNENIAVPETDFDYLVDVVEKDYDRFLKYHAQFHIAKNKENVRRNIMFFAHGIEKGLSHANFRPKFGISALKNLSRNLDLWYEFKDFDDTFFNIGLAAMKKYFVKHEELGIDVSDRKKYFSKKILNLIDSSTGEMGGVDVISMNNRSTLLNSNSFEDVVRRRRSLREWSDESVDISKIRSAIDIAITSPSVCNRQNTNVYVVTDSNKIDKALKTQGGMVGYKNPPILILVTNDIKGSSFFTERNQAFIDGGLFVMSLLLGLEYEKLAAVCLHTMVDSQQDLKIREILDVPESEALITFIAIGNLKESLLTPHSQRLKIDDILRMR